MKKDQPRDRIGVRRVEQITGLEPRTIQAMAARGAVPSAAKLGKNWTFNEAVIRRWVRQREEDTAAARTGQQDTPERAKRFEVQPDVSAAYDRLVGIAPMQDGRARRRAA